MRVLYRRYKRYKSDTVSDAEYHLSPDVLLESCSSCSPHVDLAVKEESDD